MKKHLLCRAAAIILAGTALAASVQAADLAADDTEKADAVQIPYADQFDGKTLDEVVQDFMTENQLNEQNFSISYYNTVTGESYAFNDDCMMIAASTFKLPLNMYYYQQEREGALTSDTQITGNCDLAECHYQSIVWSNNEIAHAMLYRIGNFTQYKDAMLGVFGMEEEEIDPKYYTNNFYTTRMMMSALKKLYAESDDYAELIGYMKESNPQNGYFRLYVTDCEVAHKYGSFEGAENDVGIIYAEQPFLLAVYTYYAGTYGGEELCGRTARLMKQYTDYKTACDKEAERQAEEQAAREEAERLAAEEEAKRREEARLAEEKAEQERLVAEAAAQAEAERAAAEETSQSEAEPEEEKVKIQWTDYLWVAGIAAVIVLGGFVALHSALHKVGKYEARMKNKYDRYTKK